MSNELSPSVRAVLGVTACLVLAGVACGRTVLDAPVTIDIGASAGTSGGGGRAGAGGPAGSGLAGTGGPGGAAGGGFDAGAGNTADATAPACPEGIAECVGPNVGHVCVGGRWGDAFMCPFGCINGVCNECVPNTSTCTSSQSVEVCTADGIQRASQQCPPGQSCTNGVCGGSTCVEGSQSCDGPNLVRICTGGVWKDVATCDHGCMNGVCAECAPGTSICASPTSVAACGNDGIFMPPQPCAGACTDGSCAAPGCVDGETRCASTVTEQVCKGGLWSDPIDCPFMCSGEACVQNPRKVFVSSVTIAGGDIDGLTGADDLCRKLAVGAGLSSSFAAWLGDDTGAPATRFAKDVGPYVLVDGTLVADNWIDLTTGALLHAIDLTELGGPPPLGTVGCVSPAVWTGVQNDGTVPVERGDCDDWTSTTAETAIFGSPLSTTQWSDACTLVSGTPAKACGGTAALYCFEQ